MGYSYAHNIEKAADYLLEILCSEIRVDFSHFYDGSEETEERVRVGIGVDSPCSLIDLAVIQLEEQGIVKTTVLDGSWLMKSPTTALSSLKKAQRNWPQVISQSFATWNEAGLR